MNILKGATKLLLFAKPSYWTEPFLSTTGTTVPIFLQPCFYRPLILFRILLFSFLLVKKFVKKKSWSWAGLELELDFTQFKKFALNWLTDNFDCHQPWVAKNCFFDSLLSYLPRASQTHHKLPMSTPTPPTTTSPCNLNMTQNYPLGRSWHSPTTPTAATN